MSDDGSEGDAGETQAAKHGNRANEKRERTYHLARANESHEPGREAEAGEYLGQGLVARQLGDAGAAEGDHRQKGQDPNKPCPTAAG